MLYGDPTEVLSDAEDIVELIRGDGDPRGRYPMKNDSNVPDQTVKGLYPRGTKSLLAS